jgi:hypothetical protein
MSANSSSNASAPNTHRVPSRNERDTAAESFAFGFGFFGDEASAISRPLMIMSS